jgi:hypothetical protein
MEAYGSILLIVGVQRGILGVSVVMLLFVMLNVIMLGVVAPIRHLWPHSHFNYFLNLRNSQLS